MLISKCEKAGVETKTIQPAFTSQIGHHKFMKKYGLSSHESAAMTIARKAMNFNHIEKVPVKNILQNKEGILLKGVESMERSIESMEKVYFWTEESIFYIEVF